MRKTEFILNMEGNILRRDIDENVVSIADDLIPRISSGTIHKIKDVFNIPGYGQVNMAIEGERTFFTTTITNLKIRTIFKLMDGVFVPNWGGDGQLMTMQWEPPNSKADPMHLKLILSASWSAGATEDPALGYISGAMLGKMWILAYDKDQRTWRLPLGNLYEHCELCHGQSGMTAPTFHKLIVEAIKAFENSEWNADLQANLEKPQKLFRFKPTNSGFDQQPVDKWQDLCSKVAPSFAKYIV